MQKRTSDEYERVIESVLDDIKKRNSIANRLLILAQASAELTDLNLRPLRVDEVIWKAREQLLKRHPDYTIDVDIEQTVDEEPKMIINADELLVRTLIINLMQNGCKYSENHKVKVSVFASESTLGIRFTDNGIGILPEDIGSVFEPFRRGQNATHIKGHGIGLSLADKIVKLHNGQISVDSMPGHGTVFTILLPHMAC